MFYDDDDEQYDYDPWEYELEYCEVEGCRFGQTDNCQCCGCNLCFMHAEIGGGFCPDCPTKDWIAEQSVK